MPHATHSAPHSRRIVAALTLAAAVVLATSAQASAYHGDRIGKASRAMVGFTSKDYKTHVWTTIIGTYRYVRVIRRHGHNHRVTFRGITASAQRCKSTGCWGKAKEGRLWAPHQHGHKPRSSGASGTQAGAVMDFCLTPSSTYCAAPWNWAINDPTNHALGKMRRHVVDPCIAGGLAGYGVKVSEGAAGMALSEGGTLTVAERVAGIFGPEGWAVGTMAGCFVGIGVNGVSSIKRIAASLNPFDLTGARP